MNNVASFSLSISLVLALPLIDALPVGERSGQSGKGRAG